MEDSIRPLLMSGIAVASAAAIALPISTLADTLAGSVGDLLLTLIG